MNMLFFAKSLMKAFLTHIGTTPAGPVYKHKLFLTDGWSCPFTGTCIYIFRLNTAKPLPEEGFQKDL